MVPAMRLALVAAVLLSNAALTPPQNQLEKLQGKWTLRGVNRLFGTLEIDKKLGYTYKVLPNYVEIGTVSLDSKNPTWINFSITAGSNKGNVALGTYKFEDAELHLCVGKLGDKRPSDFVDDPKMGSILWKGKKQE